MDWLLSIVMLTADGEVPEKPMTFATQAECTAAAESFVAKYPQFELRTHSDTAVTKPVVRSYVECVEKPEK